jgi:galactokinase
MNKQPPIRRVAVNILNKHTDHYVVVAEFRERLTESKQAAQKFDVQRFNLRKLSEL